MNINDVSAAFEKGDEDDEFVYWDIKEGYECQVNGQLDIVVLSVRKLDGEIARVFDSYLGGRELSKGATFELFTIERHLVLSETV